MTNNYPIVLTNNSLKDTISWIRDRDGELLVKFPDYATDSWIQYEMELAL